MPGETILIRCPGCGTLHRVAVAVGQQLRCTTCQTVFAAPVHDPSTAATPDPTSTTVPDGATAELEIGPAAAAAGGTTGFVVRHAATDASQAAPAKARRRESWRKDDRVQQPPPTPAPEPAPPARGNLFWTVVTIAALACIVVSGSILGLYVVRRWNLTPDAARDSAAASVTQPDKAAPPSRHHWTDAVRGALKTGELEIRVLRAKYGAVRAKDLNNAVITTDETNLLAITVSIHNRGAQPHAFQSWYVGTAASDEQAEMLPELADDAGRAYALLRFEDVSSIEGQRLADSIGPHQQVQDTVVFLVPDGVDHTQIHYLHLALPGDTLGARGWLRFEIPASMVRGLVDAPASLELPAPGEESKEESVEGASEAATGESDA